MSENGMVKCAISGEVLSERDAFRLKSCGCVVSQSAAKEVCSFGDLKGECVVCGEPDRKKDVLLQQSKQMQDEYM